MIAIGVTRRHILRPKCTKFKFGWGSAQTPEGADSATQGPITRFKGQLILGKGSKGKEWRNKGKKKKDNEGRNLGKGKGKEEAGREERGLSLALAVW